jgi:hypothetical protein
VLWSSTSQQVMARLNTNEDALVVSHLLPQVAYADVVGAGTYALVLHDAWQCILAHVEATERGSPVGKL